MKKQDPAFVRINSRVRQDQHLFVKKLALLHRVTEGEIHRTIIDFYIDNI